MDNSNDKFIIRNFIHLLTDHCNLRCDNCSTHSQYNKNHFSSFKMFEADIKKMSKHFHASNFMLMGGEPTLHPKLLDYINIVKSTGFCHNINLYTNGTLLHRMPDELFKEVDLLVVGQYPGTTIDYLKLKDLLDEKLDKFGTQYKLRPFTEFNIYHTDTIETNYEINKQKFLECDAAFTDNCHVIQDGYYYKCLSPYVNSKYKGYDNTLSGINIHDKEFPSNLFNHLLTDEPIDACKTCNGTKNPPSAPARQITIIKRVSKNI